MSELSQRFFHHHISNTLRWKDSKAQSEYRLVLKPYPDSKDTYFYWDVNKGSQVSWATISVRKLSNHLCLDYSVNSSSTELLFAPPKAGNPVGVSECYPSSNPDINRDPAQQWVWEDDATVRPAADKRLCLATDALEKDGGSKGTAFLQVCDGRAEQHW